MLIYVSKCLAKDCFEQVFAPSLMIKQALNGWRKKNDMIRKRSQTDSKWLQNDPEWFQRVQHDPNTISERVPSDWTWIQTWFQKNCKPIVTCFHFGLILKSWCDHCRKNLISLVWVGFCNFRHNFGIPFGSLTCKLGIVWNLCSNNLGITLEEEWKHLFTTVLTGREGSDTNKHSRPTTTTTTAAVETKPFS